MNFEQGSEHRALSVERSRLARELHDVVGHSLSVMTVQAAGARRIIETDPARAAAAIAAIERSGREGLIELRRLLTELHLEGSVEAKLHAPPSMENLPALMRLANRAGVHATLEVEGDARDLPADIELCAYRIVQEGLTNVVKHAGECRAEVIVRYRPDALELEVHDDGDTGPASPSNGDGMGSGLIGLKQRAEQLAGEFEAGFDCDGYRIRARLPIAR
jgi:signal transduction histidine kinase